MKLSRIEILPGVWLNHLQSDKFKTSSLSISLLTQLSRETASLNALIPFVLRRGTVSYPDLETLSGRMDELYGTAIEPAVRKIGEIQCVGFYSSFPEGRYLPGGKSILEDVCALICEMLLHPVTRGGLLLPAYVESERDNLIDIISSVINNKRVYSMQRCMEEMCCYEDFSTGRYGDVDSARSINYKKLTKHYHSLLQTCPVEIFYCGCAGVSAVSKALREPLATMTRGEIDYELGTDVRMNSIEPEPRFLGEQMDVSQGQLVIGWRLGDAMDDPDIAALKVFNAVFGSGTESKLFMNVREKLSLCYYAGSTINIAKGFMLVSAGIDFANFDKAKDEIFAQLEEIKKGNISPEELRAAKAGLASDLRAVKDSPSDLESYYFTQTITGLDYDPDVLAELVEEVDAETVRAIAEGVECDMIYYLSGEDDEDDE